jgi:peptidoglycan-associated lipoprotein
VNSFKVIVTLVALISLFGCASHKPKDEAPKDSAALAVDPLTLGPSGSDSGKIQGLNSIHFNFDRSVVDSADMDVLRKNAEWIKAHKDLKMQIEGHCDERGSTEYNLALGERRARAVYNILAEMGVAKDHMSIISFGEERPIMQGSSDEAYAKNRRANFVPLKMDTPAAPLAGNH